MDDLIYAHTPTLNTSYNVTGATLARAYKLLPRSADVSEFVSIEELTIKNLFFTRILKTTIY